MKTSTVKNTIELKSLETISNENKQSKEVIKLEKLSIETNLKQVCQIVLNKAKETKLKKDVSKVVALKLYKEELKVSKDFDNNVKSVFNSMVTYLLKGLSINFDEVSSRQFTKIVSYFNKVEQLPILKNGETNKNYVNGLDKVVNKTNLKACKTNEDYKNFIKLVKRFLLNDKLKKSGLAIVEVE